VLGGVVVGAEDAGTFEGDVDVEVLPRKLRRVGLVEDAGLEVGAVDGQDAVVDARPGQFTHDSVVLGEVADFVVVHHVVDADDLDVVVLQRGTHYVTTDSAKAVQADTNWVTHSSRQPQVRSKVFSESARAGTRLLFARTLSVTAVRCRSVRSGPGTPRPVRQKVFDCIAQRTL